MSDKLEILKLKEMLEEANIPFIYDEPVFSYPFYKILIYDKDGDCYKRSGR